MTATILSALMSYWRRNPLQLFTFLAGLALATALWSGVQAINAEARASYDAAAATLGEGRFDQLVAEGGDLIPQETYVALRRAGWRVSPVVEGRLEGVRVVGLDVLTAPGDLAPVQAMDGTDIEAFLLGEGQVFGRAEALELIGDVPAQKVVANDIAPGTVITDIGVAQRLLGRQGQVSRLIVDPVQPLRQQPLAEVAPELTRRVADAGSDVGRLTDSFHLNLTAFGFLSFAVGIFIVNGAIGLVFEQRRGVVRTMRALGVPLNRLIWLMILELLGFALLAGTIGVGLGYVVAAALLPDVAATLRGLYGADVGGTLSLRLIWWLSGLGMAVGGTLLASSAALWKLWRMPLLAAAKPRAWSMSAGVDRRIQRLAALGLLVVAAGLAMFGEGLAAGFALLAALLIGAALALPMLLDVGLRLGEARAAPGLRQWFWADTRQQLPGLSLALMALLLAMAANVGVSTMVSSFRLTFTGFLDQRLASELYVTASDEGQAEALEAFVTPRVRSVLPLMAVDRDLAGVPGAIYAARDDATYRDNWKFLEANLGAWDSVARGEGILVNEQLARRAGLALSEMILVAPNTSLPVVGIYGDYGNPVGQAILGEALFRQLYPEVAALRFGLRLPLDEVQGLRTVLRDEFGLSDEAMTNQAAIKAFSLEVFDRTFTVTTALNVLTLAVAAFAILMSLLTLAALRVPQLAPVWALGVTAKALGRFELIRAVLLAVLTTLCAIPLGLALAWVLLAVVNVEAFGWRLPMYFFPLDYLRLAGFAMIAALLAALWPARRLARTPPSMLLKVFSNER
ncbi:ABC transporter permease [Flavimaricola marinus]|uniref:FtsX-like permease family protein n=1 Tax=Flavimaricola marinus TaxID=1819565 RepID=A0A238LB99_9RHOB|nr:ABC transporter permease [Flavimaricola marinus]SMY07007.1 FtsX-like permease family protein [Flavimaricola marinus]